MSAVLPFKIEPGQAAVLVCASAMIFLAVAMGVGRFAFTPLFPLMVLDGLITSEEGTLLAGSNYLGYLIGALLVAWISVTPSVLLTAGLITTVIVTAAIGWTSSLTVWVILRFIAGVMSAWSLVALSAWSLGWLASVGRPNLSGVTFAGVGLGIAVVGLLCLVVPGPGITSLMMWVQLALFSAIVVVIPLVLCWLFKLINLSLLGSHSYPSPTLPRAYFPTH